MSVEERKERMECWEREVGGGVKSWVVGVDDDEEMAGVVVMVDGIAMVVVVKSLSSVIEAREVVSGEAGVVSSSGVEEVVESGSSDLRRLER